MTTVLPRAEYLASLPRKRMGVALLLVNNADELLLVKPTYRPEWLVVGGAVEAMESPLKAAYRETEEEIGLKDIILDFRCADYTRSVEEDSESCHFVFSCNPLTAAQIAAIQLQADELSDYQFLPIDKALPLLPPRLRSRVEHGWKAWKNNTAYYLENVGKK